MITSLEIKNYKCFKDFTLEGLGPFNVLLGPNDSGKTAFLEALRLVTAVGSGLATSGFAGLSQNLRMTIGPSSFWRRLENSVICIRADATKGPEVYSCIFSLTKEGSTRYDLRVGPDSQHAAFVEVPNSQKAKVHTGYFGKTNYYRLDPSALRSPGHWRSEMDSTGQGFPTFLHGIQQEELDRYLMLREEFRKRFPYYKEFRNPAGQTQQGNPGFVLQFETSHGVSLPAEGVSDGVMLSLAFMAICHAPTPPKILLIEEPENGVHHASLKEIMRTLKELSAEKGVQIFLTTHSPYLLDLVEPEEVFVFAKDDEGAVHAVKLSEYPDVEDMKKDFMTGEVWTSLDESKIVERVRGKK